MALARLERDLLGAMLAAGRKLAIRNGLCSGGGGIRPTSRLMTANGFGTVGRIALKLYKSDAHPVCLHASELMQGSRPASDTA